MNAQSWVPYYGRYTGQIVRHDEAYTIGKELAIRDENNKITYQPSVYYVYHPSDDAQLSLYELLERNCHI